ncbi:RNA polymerase sigma-70 factor, ECF subfamily [Agromyces sp. CF514]|uniref:RNA polymerase sigma factor n=1 Tax=Agromyces sp. CF514 TaxID=1881031 RepID=UPI0008F1B3F3|nr:sigma-70 family RNA polymerase sigma factor [Agromyces sp. CF514]SFR71329.1 RNA polymerase sigma-70 factor, ECF subfamily [Agromyces sp. CF514]
MTADANPERSDPAETLRAMFEEQPHRLRRRAVSLGLRHHDAEDAAQSVATAALEHVAEVRSAEEPVICAWVDTIARRVVADEYRRRDRERAFVGGIDIGLDAVNDDRDGGLGAALGLVSRSAEAEWEQRDRVLVTARAVQSLPDALREVVELRYGRDLSTRGIAEQLGLTDAAVRQRLTRARTALAAGVTAAR